MLNITMKQGFWKKLKKPILATAPMANVTDEAFRQMFMNYGGNPAFARNELRRARPSVFWTEFVSVEGLLSKGKNRLLIDLQYKKNEHPIVAQVFGSKPEQFEKAATIIRKLGFDGIDINMGCPDRDVEKQGGGAALIKNPKLAKEIIKATKYGAGIMPVSVKTRIGYSKNQIEEWIPILLEENIAALTIHLRTRKEMSDVAAHWELAPNIVTLRNSISPKTLILGNGDIDSLENAREKIKKSGMDGAMIGRGTMGNPWFFSGYEPNLHERLTCMIKHAELFEKLYIRKADRKEGRIKSFEVMKKHFKAYTSGFRGAKDLRIFLMETENAAEVKNTVEKFLKKKSLWQRKSPSRTKGKTKGGCNVSKIT